MPRITLAVGTEVNISTASGPKLIEAACYRNRQFPIETTNLNDIGPQTSFSDVIGHLVNNRINRVDELLRGYCWQNLWAMMRGWQGSGGRGQFKTLGKLQPGGPNKGSSSNVSRL
jgi:hypothetical protein